MPQGREFLEKKRKTKIKNKKPNHKKALGPKMGWPEPRVAGQIARGLGGRCKDFVFPSVRDGGHWRDLNRGGRRSDLGFNRISQVPHREGSAGGGGRRTGRCRGRRGGKGAGEAWDPGQEPRAARTRPAG